MNGSTALEYTNSESHSESTPVASRWSTMPESCSGPVSAPSPTPNRIFTRTSRPLVNATETPVLALVRGFGRGQSEKMTEPWIRGCLVQRIMFRDGLVLSLDDNELVISVPFYLTLPATGERR